MPSFEHTYSSEQLWQMVFYVKSLQKLPKEYDPSDPKRYLLQVFSHSGEIPADFKDPSWEQIKAVPVFLKQIRSEKGMVEWLMVKALHNEKEIAFYLSWEDATSNTLPQISDAVAMQFPAEKIENGAELPYLGMGHAGRPVRLWEWKPSGAKFFHAEGIQNIRPLKPETVSTTATGLYREGKWHVLFKAPLKPARNQDVSFLEVGYLSLALWDAALPPHPGPHAFSEWMLYEIQK